MEQPKKLKGNILKIVELGLQSRVYDEMKKPAFSINKLREQFIKEGFNITNQSISKFIRQTKAAQRELIAKDFQTNQQLKEITMDYSKALKAILQEVEDVKNKAKDENDLMTYNQLVGRIFQGIELIAKLTGDLQPKGKVDITVIYNQISTDIENQKKDLRKDFFKQTTVDVDFEILNEDAKLSKQLEKSEAEIGEGAD